MRYKYIALITVGLLAASGAVAAQEAQEESSSQPFSARDFEQVAPRGFDDPNNSWAQSMVWWRDALYVGTNRQAACTSIFSIWNFVRLLVSKEFADTWFPYPPSGPVLSCPPDGADLSLQAEIWRWNPDPESWQRVFQSPLDLENPGTPPEPPPPGKKLPYEIAIRGLEPHTEPDSTEALYAFGVNSTVMWDRTQLPPPRILRSTDGMSFEPIPQTPGTFLGDLPHNPDHSSFRSPESFNGKLFVISGPIFGQGSLIASADPAKGDDAWFLASSPELKFYEMEAFNGWLYLGTLDLLNGYSIVKTRAEGPPPYAFVPVIPPGAGLLEAPSRSVVSMHEYDGRLYVGTATKTEIVRINPDDTWDLVVGEPREIALSGGGTEWKYPASGLDAGFGQSLNDHAWQMLDVNGSLYIGTYNASTFYRNDPVHGPALQDSLGAHLYRTDDGWHYSAITTDGFADPLDPFGGPFDFGIRTMASTPHGVFLGTANDFYGLAIFRAEPGEDFGPSPPKLVEVETSTGLTPLLSWQAPTPAATQIWRAEVHPIRLREELNYLGWDWDIEDGNKIPDTFIGAYEPIAVIQHGPVTVDNMMIMTIEDFDSPTTLSSANTRIIPRAYVTFRAGESIVLGNGFSVEGSAQFFAIIDPNVNQLQTFAFTDSTVEPGKTYMYYITVETRQGDVSDQSNLVTFPPLTPPVTFAQLLNEVERIADLPTRLEVRAQVLAAQALAANCQISGAEETLELLGAHAALTQPGGTDLKILTAKLVRRLKLFERFPQDVSSGEFCP